MKTGVITSANAFFSIVDALSESAGGLVGVDTGTGTTDLMGDDTVTPSGTDTLTGSTTDDDPLIGGVTTFGSGTTADSTTDGTDGASGTEDTTASGDTTDTTDTSGTTDTPTPSATQESSYMDITGDARANFLLGTPQDDLLNGQGGDDTLVGNGGVDAYLGGPGDDVFQINEAIVPNGEVYEGGPGTDRFLLNNFAVFNWLVLDAAASVEEIGNSGRYSITATNAANRIDLSGVVDNGDLPLIALMGGDDTFHGSYDDDLVSGGAGRDYIFAGAGDDTIYGGPGDDTLRGGIGDDLIRLNEDSIGSGQVYSGGGGTDTISFQNDIMINRLTLDEVVSIEIMQIAPDVGVAGTDIGDLFNLRGVSGYIGLSTLSLGFGEDLFFGSDIGDDAAGGNDADWMMGWAGDDTLAGGSHNDTISGGEGDDLLLGGSGDDSLSGDEGSDTIVGGLGDDTAVFGFEYVGDEITVVGNDVLVTTATGTVTTREVEYLEFVNRTVSVSDMTGVPSIVPLRGTGDDDEIIGGSLSEKIEGFGSGDILSGLGGDDSIFGGAGDDTLLGGAGDDILDGGAGADLLNGGIGNDTVSYESATTSVRLDMEQPALTLGDAVGDTFVGIEGIQTGNTIDQLRGDAEGNVFYTGGLSDRLYGRAGDDTLYGEGGADAFYGGMGADVMTGGDDADRRDRYIYFSIAESGVGAGERDIITDFVSGEDRIEIWRFDADMTSNGNDSFTFIETSAFGSIAGQLRYYSEDQSTIVQADVDGDGVADFEIELVGVMSLSAEDFLL